jgi:hypothetical protein
MTELDDIYRRLAGRWTAEQLDACYREARRRGARAGGAREAASSPISFLAYAIPAAASFSVAIHALHLLPGGESGRPARRHVLGELLETAGNNAAAALDHVHHALRADGAAHGYTADDWLPTVYDITVELLGSARIDTEPPTFVGAAQDAISWLARAVAEVDQNSAETPSSLAEVLARLLAGYLCAVGGPSP